MSIVSAVLVVTVMGLLGAAILVVAAQYLSVEEDPRVEGILEFLPGINCGTCGYAGCKEYAAAIVESDVDVKLCRPGGPKAIQSINELMAASKEATGEVAAG